MLLLFQMWSISRRKSAHPPAPGMQLLICELLFSIFQARTSEVLFHLEGIAVHLHYLASSPCHNIFHRDIDYLNILLDIILAHDINEIMLSRTYRYFRVLVYQTPFMNTLRASGVTCFLF